jgi:hypothetical protein
MLTCSKSRFVFLALTGSLAAIQGCADPHEIDDLGCPCAPGYICRLEDQTCVARDDSEPPAPVRCTRTLPECSLDEADISDQFGPEETKAAVIGRWLMCEGSQPTWLHPPDDLIGFEFRADGTWIELRKNSAGECDPHPGFLHEGTWWVEESPVHPGVYRVVTTEAGSWGAASMWEPAFSAVPRRVARLFHWRQAIADRQ